MENPAQRLGRIMAKAKETEEPEFSKDGQDKSALLKLVEFTFDTPPEKLAEMTHLPLDMIHSLSMMRTYAAEFLLLSDAMKEAQKEYNQIWGEYHRKDKLVDMATDSEYDEHRQGLLMLEWLYSFYQHRRSIGGDHHMGAITLAQDQITADMQKPPDEFADFRPEQ